MVRTRQKNAIICNALQILGAMPALTQCTIVSESLFAKNSVSQTFGLIRSTKRNTFRITCWGQADTKEWNKNFKTTPLHVMHSEILYRVLFFPISLKNKKWCSRSAKLISQSPGNYNVRFRKHWLGKGFRFVVILSKSPYTSSEFPTVVLVFDYRALSFL